MQYTIVVPGKTIYCMLTPFIASDLMMSTGDSGKPTGVPIPAEAGFFFLFATASKLAVGPCQP
jgi:hypothetical protein